MSPFQSSRKMIKRGALSYLCSTRIAVLLIIPTLFFSASPAVGESHQRASSSSPGEERADPLTFNTADDPSGGFDDQGRPHRRSSGGSRGHCRDQLIALLPGHDTITLDSENCSHQSATVPALTLSPNPILWFHIPEYEEAVAAEFVLLGENSEAIAIQDLTLPPEAGIIAVQIEHPLALNQSYPWVFSILEMGRSPSLNPTVEGSIRYLEADAPLTNALDLSQTPRERVTVLADHHIWHDALTELAHLYPFQLTRGERIQDWNDFLDSVGLNAISESPLLDCCINVDDGQNSLTRE